jgi:opacity protein-like surface antigen
MIPAMLLTLVVAAANAETPRPMDAGPTADSAVALDTAAPAGKKAPLALPGTPDESWWRRMAEETMKRPEKAAPEPKGEISIDVGNLTSATQLQGLNGHDDLSAPGIFYALRYLHDVAPHLAIGLQGEALMPGDRTSQVLLTNNNTNTHFEAFDAMGMARVQFGSGRLRPYVMGGVGVYSAYLNIDSRPKPGYVWPDTGVNDTRTLVDSSSGGFIGAFQAGLDYDLFSSVRLGAFFSYRHLGTAAYGVTADANAQHINGVSGSYDAIMFGGSLAGRF